MREESCKYSKEITALFMEQKTTRKKTYYSSYKLGGRTYSSFIVATSKKRAQELAEKRGIGESVDGSLRSNDIPMRDLPSSRFKAGDYLSCLHGLIFFSWIAVSAGAIHVNDSIADTGIVHEMLHFIQYEDEDGIIKKDVLLKKIKTFEKKVPGLM